MALDPSAASRRSVCVSHSRGHPLATIGAIDASGSRTGGGLTLRDARVRVKDDALTLQAPASRLKVTLGRRVAWQAFVRFNDGGPCAQALAPIRARARSDFRPPVGGRCSRARSAGRRLRSSGACACWQPAIPGSPSRRS